MEKAANPESLLFMTGLLVQDSRGCGASPGEAEVGPEAQVWQGKAGRQEASWGPGLGGKQRSPGVMWNTMLGPLP